MKHETGKKRKMKPITRSLGLIALSMTLLLSACGNGEKSKEAGKTGAAGNTAAPAAASATAAQPTLTVPIEEVDFTERTLSVQELLNCAKIQGRTKILDTRIPGYSDKQNVLTLEHTADSIEFNLVCQGKVTAELCTLLNASLKPVYFTVYVDGVKQKTRADWKFGGNETHNVTLAENLEAGAHSFRLVRQNESERGRVFFKSVTFCGEMGSKPAPGALRIEFVGDSITAGYSNLFPNLTEDTEKGAEPDNVYEDGTQAYAYLTAERLHADYSIVAQQGIGVMPGFLQYTMRDMYDKFCYQLGRRDVWDFADKADVVVINLGTNDAYFMGEKKFTEKQLQAACEELLHMVRKNQPDAVVIWAYGMMHSDAVSVIKAALDACGGEASGYYFVALEREQSGGYGHPGVPGHLRNSEILSEAIQKLVSKKS